MRWVETWWPRWAPSSPKAPAGISCRAFLARPRRRHCYEACQRTSSVCILRACEGETGKDENQPILDPRNLVATGDQYRSQPRYTPSHLPCSCHIARYRVLGEGLRRSPHHVYSFFATSPMTATIHESHTRNSHVLMVKAHEPPSSTSHGRDVKSARLETTPILGLQLGLANAQVPRTR